MHNDTASVALGQRLKLLGPGIMTAAAAVGGSHLVASTKAGAIYGWQLVPLIVLVNLLKYPFFLAGVQYTMATGESLVEGYRRLGRGYLILFGALVVIAGVINTAALTLFSASLLGYFLPVSINPGWVSAGVLLVCLLILFLGRFQALDGLSKLIMVVLSVASIAAVVIAGAQYQAPVDATANPSAWSIAAIGFVVITMGWMPAPIEISSLTSMWLKRQRELTAVTPTSARVDFNVGYVGTTLLALVFVAMGALIINGRGVELASTGVAFSRQLVGMYSSSIGAWSGPLIGVVAFFCIFGSTITVIDGYSRVIAESQRLLGLSSGADFQRLEHSWMLILAVVSLLILLFFAAALMPLMNFAMIMAFITTPFFALLNYLLVSRNVNDGSMGATRHMLWLSRLGLVYLFGFLGVFLWWKLIL
ncbi:NRAMP family divalent metal transporter [Congregibacter sp.]|uniref:NRAMP family divalent metal transporter n=1 Tax=Congregibacter sp. TaxID=2744308 RepID=UPI003F6DA446